MIDNFTGLRIFNGMLKNGIAVKLEAAAVEQLRKLLGEVPFLSIEAVETNVWDARHRREIDFFINVRSGGKLQRLICEVKSNGQPRMVRSAIDHLKNILQTWNNEAYGIVVAPYLSPVSQEICREEKVGFLDLEGNCRLIFDGVFIERAVPLRPITERREFKSIFAPKSAQVLRLLLRNPERPWKVAELARYAGVSVGHISNIRRALIDREWATLQPDGIVLVKPDELLNSWRDAYQPPARQRTPFYTTLHGGALQQELPKILSEANKTGRAMLASFSAAHWLAPYARTSTNFFYADETGLSVLRDRLNLISPSRGENIVILQIEDRELFNDAVEPAPDILCTSPVQTYLDLYKAGDRGREAAQYLREEKLKWHKK